MIYVISVIVLLVAVELLLRTVINKSAKKKLIESRKEVLSESLKHDFSSITVTLKRVELQNPNARVLVVDRDEQILDKLRSMLVLDGYSVDTVASGNEAHQLSLINHYDFIFTGEKTRDISGQDVTKRVMERRSDINVVLMTEGIASSTPYDLIREGAIDFISKPHVDSRLNEFVREQLKVRREKIETELKQTTRAQIEGEFIPNGLFLTKNHIWAAIEPNGIVKIGIDKFASDYLGIIDTIDFANLNIQVSKENPLFIIKKNFKDLQFISPCAGRVVSANVKLREHLYRLHEAPYTNWICTIEPENISEFVKDLMIGSEADKYIAESFDNLKNDLITSNVTFSKDGNHQEKLTSEAWQTIIGKYFAV